MRCLKSLAVLATVLALALPAAAQDRMKAEEKCACEKPVLQEQSDQKGSSVSWCGRCKRPLSLRPAVFRSAFA